MLACGGVRPGGGELRGLCPLSDSIEEELSSIWVKTGVHRLTPLPGKTTCQAAHVSLTPAADF